MTKQNILSLLFKAEFLFGEWETDTASHNYQKPISNQEVTSSPPFPFKINARVTFTIIQTLRHPNNKQR